MALRFATCRLDPDRHVFARGGEVLHLEPQVFDVIRVLAQAGGRMLSREDLVAEVWGGLNVSDATIAARISAARRAVGDDGRQQGIIETVPRRGFRLAVPVEEETDGPPPARAAAAARDLPTLAVLPFAHPGAASDDMLADGVVEEITGALARVREFHVIARQSAAALGAGPIDIATAAERLGADYLVQGSVRRADDRVRLRIDLADASGRTIWSERFDDRLDDLFDLQERIAVQVAGHLAVPLRSAEIALARSRDGGDPDARNLVLRAMPLFWAHHAAENAQALELFSRALDLDPDNVAAMAYKSWALAQAVTYMWVDEPERRRAEARALADRAAARVGDDPPALVALSAAYSLARAEGTAPISFARRALAIDPSNAWGRMRLGYALIYAGQPEAALPEFDHARRLSPLDPFLFNFNLGTATALSRIGRLAEAIALTEQTISDFPGIGWSYRLMSSFYGQAGLTDKAVAAGRLLMEATPGITLERLRRHHPIMSPEVGEIYYRGLRLAGIPES